LHAVLVGFRFGEVFALAVLAGTEDAAGADRLLILLPRFPALLFARLGHVLADGLSGACVFLLRGDPIAGHGEAVLLCRRTCGSGFGALPAAIDLDQLGS